MAHMLAASPPLLPAAWPLHRQKNAPDHDPSSCRDPAFGIMVPIRVILGLYWGYIGAIWGIMETKMETIIMGSCWVVLKIMVPVWVP